MPAVGCNDNVFINCPFDAEYTPLLRVIVFTVYHLPLWFYTTKRFR